MLCCDQVLRETKLPEQKKWHCSLVTQDASSTTESNHVECTGNHQDHKPAQRRSSTSHWNFSTEAQETDPACGWKKQSHLTAGLLERLIKRSRSDNNSNSSANPTKRRKKTKPHGGQRNQNKDAVPATVDSCPAASSPMGTATAAVVDTSFLGPQTKPNSSNHADSQKKNTYSELDQADCKHTKARVPYTADGKITEGCGDLSAVYPKDVKIADNEGGSVTYTNDGLLLQHKGFCKREQHLIDLQDSGELRSVYVQNDGNWQHMVWYAGNSIMRRDRGRHPCYQVKT